MAILKTGYVFTTMASQKGKDDDEEAHEAEEPELPKLPEIPDIDEDTPSV